MYIFAMLRRRSLNYTRGAVRSIPNIRTEGTTSSFYIATHSRSSASWVEDSYIGEIIDWSSKDQVWYFACAYTERFCATPAYTFFPGSYLLPIIIRSQSLTHHVARLSPTTSSHCKVHSQDINASSQMLPMLKPVNYFDLESNTVLQHLANSALLSPKAADILLCTGQYFSQCLIIGMTISHFSCFIAVCG